MTTNVSLYRGITETKLTDGTKRSSLDQFTIWTQRAEKAPVFDLRGAVETA